MNGGGSLNEALLERVANATNSYLEASNILPCYLVNSLARNREEQCKFVIDNECIGDDGLIDYVHLVYCAIGYEFRYAAIGLIIFLVIVLFLNLGSVADECLCPSLLTVAKNLRMSDSLAGVTLLAFGNGCPDIFSSLAAAASHRPKLIIGELLGAGIFCTSIVAGLVLISTEFKPDSRPLLRDGIFYLISVCLVWYYCWQRSISFYGSLAFIIIYLIYLIVALSDQFIQARLSKIYLIADAQAVSINNTRKTKDKGPILDENSFIWRRGSQGIVAEVQKQHQQADNKQSQQPNDDMIQIDSGRHHITQQLTCSCSIMSSSGQKEKVQIISKTETHDKVPVATNSNSTIEHINGGKGNKKDNGFTLEEWDQFIIHLNPIDIENWSETGIIGKIIQILRAPLLFATILTVPVVDLDKTNNNWCRLLNSLHCFIIPTSLIFFTNWEPSIIASAADYHLQDTAILNGANNEWIAPMIKCIMTVPGIILSVLVFKVTGAFKAPKYHAIYAYFGFAMSIVWIYLLANEIIGLLKTAGIMFSMTDTAIGLGVLAWGNSLGDIVANLSLAEAGYPRMALGASIGAPLLNTLLGFGLSFLVSLKPGQESPIEYTPTITLLCSTLTIVLILIMLSTLIPSQRSRKPFGFVLISGYAIYFLLAVCLECGILFRQNKT